MNIAFESARVLPSKASGFASSSEVQAKRDAQQNRARALRVMIAAAQDGGGKVEQIIKLGNLVAPHLTEDDFAWLSEMTKTHHPDPKERHSDGTRKPVLRDDMHKLQQVEGRILSILRAAEKNPQIEIVGLDILPTSDVAQAADGTGVGVAVSGDPKDAEIAELRRRLGM